MVSPPEGAPSTEVIVTPAEVPIVEPGTPPTNESSEEPIVEPTTPRAESIAGFLHPESDQETPEQTPMTPSSLGSQPEGSPDTSPLAPSPDSAVPELKLDPDSNSEPTSAGADTNAFN